ncbi:CDP-glycerol glycerophosphotransferase family protein [Arthrobacter rhombi]|uniref:Putative integral membrane protein n=1 Tax=Arthrobacter rhombi TaxID=71253 RepID=A0A1R4FNQ0_9MICC|nr:CDP-glycerol glycerophosphotransferase family protein [Arthrobacter rhombi]SJM57546.1 putative integral membrane protein [Arthrobacter rhombi]
MKHKVGKLAQTTRKAIVWSLGGFLPQALSRRTTLIAASIAGFLLVAFPANIGALVVGALLAAAVCLSEAVLALTSTPQSVARHSTISIPYMALLALGVGAVYAAHSTYLPSVMWISLFLLTISTWLASAIPVFSSTKPLVATNFNFNPRITKLSGVQVKGFFRLAWAAFAVIAIFAFLSVKATPWVSLALSLLAFSVAAWSMVNAWIYADRARWRTLRELRRLRPKAVIPYGGTATYQAEMWYPYIDRLGEPYFIVSLTEKTMNRLAANTNRPIVVPDEQTAADVRNLVPDSVSIAYYPHNAAKNSLFRADKRYTHVFVHHGDGDKAPSFNPNSAKYDFLFVAGQGAIDRYARNGVKIIQSKFKVIGRPPTEAIEVDRTPIAEKTRPTVLYAPTWYGKNKAENYSSLTFGPDIVEALIKRDVNVIFRPHPASRSNKEFAKLIKTIQAMLERDSEHSNRRHRWGAPAESDATVSDVTNASDAMIADVSGIVTDYLQSGKPYAMATTRFTPDEFNEKFPTSRSGYVVTPSNGDLTVALDRMLGDDPLAAYRWEQRTYYLGGFNGRQAVENFLNESRTIMSSK